MYQGTYEDLHWTRHYLEQAQQYLNSTRTRVGDEPADEIARNVEAALKYLDGNRTSKGYDTADVAAPHAEAALEYLDGIHSTEKAAREVEAALDVILEALAEVDGE